MVKVHEVRCDRTNCENKAELEQESRHYSLPEGWHRYGPDLETHLCPKCADKYVKLFNDFIGSDKKNVEINMSWENGEESTMVLKDVEFEVPEFEGETIRKYFSNAENKEGD